MYTHDVAQMLFKPPSHIWLICHFIHKVQDKSEENTVLSKY